jgi:hypothetical protein
MIEPLALVLIAPGAIFTWAIVQMHRQPVAEQPAPTNSSS